MTNTSDIIYLTNGNVTSIYRLIDSSEVQSTHCSENFPETWRYFHDKRHNVLDACFLGISYLLTVATVVGYIQEIRVVNRTYRDPLRRQRVLIVLGIYPVESFLSCLSLVIPRSTTLVDLTASCYLSVCMYMFLEIVFMYFGGTANMARTLAPTQIRLDTPPICCCCGCIPSFPTDRNRLRTIQKLVMQVAIIRPLLLFISAVLWADNRKLTRDISGRTSPYLYIVIVTTISTLIAVYNLQILVKVSEEDLRDHKVRTKFRLIQLVLIMTNLQSVIFSVLAKFNLPPCKGVLGSVPRAASYCHMLIVLEMFVLFVVATRAYRKSDNRNINENIVLEPPGRNTGNDVQYMMPLGSNEFIPLPQQDKCIAYDPVGQITFSTAQ